MVKPVHVHPQGKASAKCKKAKLLSVRGALESYNDTEIVRILLPGNFFVIGGGGGGNVAVVVVVSFFYGKKKRNFNRCLDES